MELNLIKDEYNKFHPLTESDNEKASKIPIGEDNLFVLKRVRNIRFHRKYFGLIRLAFQNQEKYGNEDDFRKVMQMRAGYYHRVITDKGVAFIPNSISFESMDADEFSDLYDKVFTVIKETLLLSVEDAENFEMQLNQFC